MGNICQEERDKRNFIFEDFFTDKDSSNYDMILNFNSFEQLRQNGWTANFTIEGKNKYDNSINENNVVIGVLGNKNRGKSYLLERIMKNKDYKSPSGFLVTTYGISCNFPTLEDTGGSFVTLDTAGKDSPLLKNAFFGNTDIKTIARDQKITEIVLSDFIIQESNILIAVVEQLSFEEQEMLKTLIERLKQKDVKGIQKRKLIVIHNLMNISSVDGIYNFINDTLDKSLTFVLESQSMGRTDEFDDSKKKFYIQKIENDGNNKENQSKLEIIHLIFGNDKDDHIKKEFNEPALRFIRDAITIDSSRKFNIVKAFKDFIIKNSKKYMTGDGLPKDSLIIGKEQKKKVYVDKERSQVDDRIIIPISAKNNKDIPNLKGLYTNYKGKENFFNKINVRYSSKLIQIKEHFYIKIVFELFGKIKKLTRKIDSDNDDNDQYIITFKGEVEEIDDKTQKTKAIGNLEYTEFDFQVKIKKYLPTKKENTEFNIEILENEEQTKIEIESNDKGIYKLLLKANADLIDNS